MAYNTKNNITPTQIKKAIDNILNSKNDATYAYDNSNMIAAEEAMNYASKTELENSIKTARKNMELAAKELDFINAAKFRDQIKVLKDKVKSLTS